MAFYGTSTYSSTQLVQLRQPKALRIFDNHHACVGDIDTDLNNGRRDQDINAICSKGGHHLRFLISTESPV